MERFSSEECFLGTHKLAPQDLAVKLGIQDNVAICATALEEGDIRPGVVDMLCGLGKSLPSQGKLGLVIRHGVINDWDSSRIGSIVSENRDIGLYVALYKFTVDFFSQLHSML